MTRRRSRRTLPLEVSENTPMDFGDTRLRDFRREVLQLFLYVALGVSAVVVPVYYRIGTGGLTLACAAYLTLVAALCWHINWRHNNLRHGANLFLGATLLVMLSGLYLGNELLDNKPWQMVFPMVAFLVAGARDGLRWSVSALLASLVVLGLRWSAYEPLAMLIFVLAHVTMSFTLYVFVRSNEENIRTISRLSHTDTLTNVYNRQLFDELFVNVFNRARRAEEALAVYMIDIDHFKKFNDAYGHVGGDRALRAVANVIRTSARRATDLVFRYGGEEFCVVSSGLSLNDARTIADNIIQGVRELDIAHSGAERGKLTVSIGLSYHTLLTEHDTGRLLEQADRALYAAKLRGRDRLECRAIDAVVMEPVEASA